MRKSHWPLSRRRAHCPGPKVWMKSSARRLPLAHRQAQRMIDPFNRLAQQNPFGTLPARDMAR